MNERCRRGPIPRILFALCLWLATMALAAAQTAAPASPPTPGDAPQSAAPKEPAPATPKTTAPAPATPEAKPAAPSATPVVPVAPPVVQVAPPVVQVAPPVVPVAPAPPAQGAPAKPLAPGGPPRTDEIEPNASPQTPGSATMETIDVPARPIVFAKGQSSYEDAFKSIKASQASVKAAMDKAGLKATGHPITIFTDTDDKGFRYEAAIPIASKPEKADLGNGVAFGQSPAGSGLKFQHRGPFDEIDSTYDLIVSYLDEKGLQIEPPYIEEYIADLTTPDDPNLEVDIYVFVKK